MNPDKTIAVVGAGIVGCSCALWLQKKGYSVVLIDPDKPGAGTSSGNACTIADYACLPVNSPSVFTDLPKFLFSKNSPLSIDIGHAITHLPWLIEFLSNCRPRQVAHITRTLGSLLKQTYDGLDPLIDYCDAQYLFERRGILHLYHDQAEFDDAKANRDARRDQGVEFVEVDAEEIRALEPGLKMGFDKGILFDQVSQVLNPQALTTRFFDTFMTHGGDHRIARVLAVSSRDNGVELNFDDGSRLCTDRAVIAAGAYSTQINGISASPLPLETERGYHIQFNGLQSLLNRPVTWSKAGFYAVPMNEGLRCAGTVELAGLSAPKRRQNLDYMTRLSRQMFELPEQPDQEWLGFRPSFPDALPAIGYSQNSNKIICAFGHQHIGLTLSGITGKLVSELINEEPLSHNIDALSPKRFI